MPKRFLNKHNTQRKIYIQDQYLDIQLCDKHLIYSIEISKYSSVIILEIFILTYSKTPFIATPPNRMPPVYRKCGGAPTPPPPA